MGRRLVAVRAGPARTGEDRELSQLLPRGPEWGPESCGVHRATRTPVPFPARDEQHDRERIRIPRFPRPLVVTCLGQGPRCGWGGQRGEGHESPRAGVSVLAAFLAPGAERPSLSNRPATLPRPSPSKGRRAFLDRTEGRTPTAARPRTASDHPRTGAQGWGKQLGGEGTAKTDHNDRRG